MISKESKETILSEKLWTSWLEYLIVMQIVKEKVLNNQDLCEIFNNIRLIHSDTYKDWFKIMDDIFETDLYGLSEKGILIVSTNQKPEYNLINEGLINDISNASSVSEFKTDNANHPLSQFKFIHIKAFEKLITDHQIDLNSNCTGINLNKLEIKLKEIFDEIL